MDRAQFLEQANPLLQEREWRKCKADPAYWIEKYVWTFDAHNREEPYKKLVQFPGELPYLGLVVEKYRTERRLVFLKSRQLRITWICCALDVHEALFYSARWVPITAFKEDDAADILNRCEFIVNGNPAEAERAPGLPMWMRQRNPMERKKKPHEMVFARGGVIRAVAEGEENLRGKTVSRWRCEEARSQPKLEGTAGGIIPTLQQTGQACFVSSAGPGYFDRLVHDKLETKKPPPPDEIPTGLHGVRMWRNKLNGYLIVRIHYTADPAKRDPMWLATVTAGMPSYQVAMEYEIDFSARGGEIALDFFLQNKNRIVLDFTKRFPLGIPKWWPRIAGSDYGITSPYACLFAAISPVGELFVYWEYYSPGPLGDHLAVITNHEDWTKIQLYILDKSCWAATQQVSETSVEGRTLHAVRSIADLHQTAEPTPVYPIPAMVKSDPVKVECLAREWKENPVMEGWQPTLFISDQCVNLIQELHGIKWAPEKPDAVHHEAKLVDRDNHAFDALCYQALHYREAGLDPNPVQIHATCEEIQEHWRKQRIEGYLHRKEHELTGVEMVDEYGRGDEPYGLVH